MRNFSCINVTIPYKKAVIPFLDELSDRAKRIGSVNVVVRRPDSTLLGDNSDYDGFASMIYKSKIKVKGKKVLVLGSGGASVTVQTVLSDLGCKNVIVISRQGENNYNNIQKHADADVIVNTTPVGMYPNVGVSPVDLSVFTGLSGVLDLIYNPYKTQLILDAEEKGIPALGGLRMLVAQAVKANEMFFSKKLDAHVTDKIEKKIASMMKNVVLIGMPGCGKSTIGKRIANLTGRPFVDLDREIVELAGKTIPEIFEEDGEEVFRQMETQVAAKYCKEKGYIISCGGGIVTRPENKNILRQNSTVVFIARNLQSLTTKGRPLSQTRSVDDLWQSRSAAYNAWSDYKLFNAGITPSAVSIIKALNLDFKKREEQL